MRTRKKRLSQRTQQTGFGILSRSIVLVAMLAALGCARFHQKKSPTKYQTVSASGRHDTVTAKKKHSRALVLLEEKVDLAKVEQLLNDALVADVTYGPAHNSLGTLYYMQKKLYLAAWEFEYAAKLMPELAQPYNNLGLVYERVGKYEDAITHYSMALSREPHNSELIGNLVRTRMLDGDRGADIKQLLSDLALNHTQTRWQNWARDQVELTNFEGTASLPSDWRIPEKMPEQLPLPVSQVDVETAEVPTELPQLQFPESIQPKEALRPLSESGGP